MIESQVAVIGAGISGCLTAIQLKDSGLDVVLLDSSGEAMTGASRWNEGKIHLGYCYLADSTGVTPRVMLDGAAAFVERIESLTERGFKDEWFTQPVVYIVDPDTQFPVDLLWARSQQQAAHLIERATAEVGLRRYVDKQSVLRRLEPDDAAQATGLDRISAAWTTSERCVAPGPVAALIREAIEQRRIPLIRATAQTVSRAGRSWLISTDRDKIKARVVVNASWESRALLDRWVAELNEPCSIRYKYALFGCGLKALSRVAPSTRIVGRFGDVTPYGNGEAYLSWYPDGLAGVSDDGTPPIPDEPARDILITQTLAGLGIGLDSLEMANAVWEVRGGYVVAHGSGDIDRASSPLHHRDRFGALELAPGYVSVDTGKYSCGPMMASRAAALVERRISG